MTHVTRCECGDAWCSPKVEHCTVCHRTFSSTSAGDRHRVGQHGVTTGPDRRRCLTDTELATARLTGRTNRYGTTVWGHPGSNPNRRPAQDTAAPHWPSCNLLCDPVRGHWLEREAIQDDGYPA